MNALLPLLLAACGAQATQAGPTAAEFFASVEARFVEAARVSIQGSVIAKHGKREGKLEASAAFEGGSTFEIRGDGTFAKGKLGWSIACTKGEARTSSVFDDPEHGEGEVTGSVEKSAGEEEATRTDDKERDARRAVLRCGLLLSVNRFPGGKFGLDRLVAEDPANLAFGPETKLNDRPVRVLRYDVSMEGGKIFTHELWIDRETLAVLSRDIRSEGGKTSIREVYAEAGPPIVGR